jgi:hypothetical protein
MEFFNLLNSVPECLCVVILPPSPRTLFDAGGGGGRILEDEATVAGAGNGTHHPAVPTA